MFPYVESHNFYVEHWYHTIFWNKVREFGALLADHRFLEDAEDIFYLQRHEVSDALVDLRLAWAAGSEGRGPGYWPPIVARRKRIMDAMRRFTPPPALGAMPDAITEPMTIMLWGITTERVREWAAEDRDTSATLTGFAGSPGMAEGTARVVLEVERLATSSPERSWWPRSPRRAGRPCSARSPPPSRTSAGSCRTRRSSPASTGCRRSSGPGTRRAGSRPATGVRVDGNTGTVTILR